MGIIVHVYCPICVSLGESEVNVIIVASTVFLKLEQSVAGVGSHPNS